MHPYILGFHEPGAKNPALTGGKGANLAALSAMPGISVPAGFCITTAVYREITTHNLAFNTLLAQLETLKITDRDAIRDISANIRAAITATPLPSTLVTAMAEQLHLFKENQAFAVRSSATAEDLPHASFAGQQDSYLDITGLASLLRHVSKCMASLYTERAVIYRMQQGFDHRKVQLSVVIQQMVPAEAAGMLFTADPVTGHRKISSIDAGLGLGAALVAGMVNADHYKVSEGSIIEKKTGNGQVLTDLQALQLAELGHAIEQHFGGPQDIEWCLAGNAFYIVQSRPITTLFPLPAVPDNAYHVYVSVGHQQMMTDAMKPLGLSVFQHTAGRTMYNAGGRLFVDIAPDLAIPEKRTVLVDVLGKADPLFKDALHTLLERNHFPSPPETPAGSSAPAFHTLNDYDPSVVQELIQKNQASVQKLQEDIQTQSGAALIDFILDDIAHMRKILWDPQNFGVVMTSMNAAFWINDKMQEWLGEKNAADTLVQSAPYNITAEMGLALMGVADVIRPYPEIIAFLQQATAENFPGGLVNFNGGQQVLDAIRDFLHKYGMRCAGEIDITKTRWQEKPVTLVPVILNNIKTFAPHAAQQKFEQGLQEALEKERSLRERLLQLPDGAEKARETTRMIRLLRNLAGYREYPKYGNVARYFIYKQALLREAQQLVQLQVLQEATDIYYLTLEELRDVLDTHSVDNTLIATRKNEVLQFEKLTPPRIMTSDGEIITGAYRREHLPAGAMAGLAVSSGIVEGRARVIVNMEQADLAPGDILVTTFTDPSWTPLFVSIKGLVTEVGGLMTHGAVIAREYGLPAVVGVENATKLIRDGQRIRVNGTDGYVALLSKAP
ncbi:phosphoenolpyruvate synthase [Chitinophaga parva]|uniref:Prodigiosin synthesizing transferase PigC n=1 Tax=Chitinophaga parva TaxID=2169414 RepID=A0A2T7BHV8_9BACT|nr:phosphoenolpyruvate synthase [Chitinophaga parva]PUZ25833.1 phosphoenolpyruvate synthase [Chitinophaga parva]